MTNPLKNTARMPSNVAAVEAWAAVLNAKCAAYIDKADEHLTRLQTVAEMCRHLGRLKDKAARVEMARDVRSSRLDEGSPCVVDDAPPVSDPLSLVLWSYYQLAQLAYRVATQEQPDCKAAKAKARLLAQGGFLPCNAEFDRIIEQAKTESKRAKAKG